MRRSRVRSSIREQETREIISNEDYDGFNKRRGFPHEDVRANPDVLDDDQHFYAARATENEVKERVKKLLELSKQILTEQQYHVFVMMAVKEPHLTVREVAKVMSLSSARVGQLWQAARKKLEKAYEQRTA